MENQTNFQNQAGKESPAKPRKAPPAFFNVGNALKVTCVGFGVGVVLRTIQMLYYFDYDTGFYTDGGFLAGCSLVVPLLAALLGGVMCFCSRRYFGPYIARKNNTLGVVAGLSGMALLASAILQLLDYLNYLTTGASAYGASERGFIHVAFLIACFLFGTVQLFVSVGFFQGRNFLRKMPLLYLLGVFWGVAYLILVYVFYAKSSSFVENAFAVGGGASVLLSVFYLCKVFAGVEEESAVKRLFVTGIFAVVLTVPYSFSNLVLMLLGKSYLGEIPSVIQLASLSVSLFLLVFMMTFRKYGVHRLPKDPALREQNPAVPAEEPAKPARRFRPN